MPRATPKQWRREIEAIAAELSLPNITLETSKKNHIKVYSDHRLVCTCSSTPGDPAILYAYRRHMRAFKARIQK